MKVSGFAIARNVVRADYPIEEALKSISPICDELIVAVGKSEDGTRDKIQSLDIENLKIIDTIWDDSLREGGRVLADETNKALAAVAQDSDWCFYIQADECVHEDDLSIIKKAMQDHLNDYSVDGFLFQYQHFYGSYDYIGDSRRWYRKEIRIIRNDKKIKSWKDAQGFRTLDDQKLRVIEIPARIFHYGWVKHPKEQQQKHMQFHRLWHDDQYMEKKVANKSEFDYSGIDSLIRYQGTHPSIMKKRIERVNWQFDYDVSRKNFTLKSGFLYWFEKLFGVRIGEYKNYKVIK
jgi:hypothetical protein